MNGATVSLSRRRAGRRADGGGRRALPAIVACTLALVGAVVVQGAKPVSADASNNPPDVQERTAATVTSDNLPTVQIDDGVVWSQAVVGNTVYAGGSFSNARPAGAAKGTSLSPRANLLSYDITTGNLLPFAPTLNGQVYAVALSPDKTRLYVGGSFTTVNSTNHFKLAAFDTATGNLIAGFKAQIGGSYVKAITATNNAVYVGGLFSQANGAARANLAAFDLNGNALSWAPTTEGVNASGKGPHVDAILATPAADKIIVGGTFTQINGVAQKGLVALTPDTAAITPWAATSVVVNGDATGYNSGIYSLTTDGTKVYGTGWVYGGITKGNLEGTFAADPSTGNIVWVEDCHGDEYSAFSDSTTVYTTGHIHDCSGIGSYPQAYPAPGNMRHADAFTADVRGTLTHTDTLGPNNNYKDWYGTASPAQINWYPDFTTGAFTGQGQAAWSLAGNGTYVVAGGEFPYVNGKAQYGLVRFARASVSGAKDAPRLAGTRWAAKAISATVGSIRLSIPQNYDRDSRDLTYSLRRATGTTAPLMSSAPIYTTTLTSLFWNSQQLTFTDRGLTPGQVYTYQWAATDPNGNVSKSAPTTATVTSTDLSPYAQDMVADGASHYWRLGEAAGATTGNDLVGTANLTLQSGAALGNPGALTNDADTAASFNGTTTGFADTTAVENGPNVFSVAAWFRTTTTSGGRIVGFGTSSTGTSSNRDRQIYMDNAGHLYYGVYNGSNYTVATSGTYNDGGWHQVVATLGSAGMTLFVDGRRVGTNPNTTAGQAYSGYWRIGGDGLSGWPAAPTSSYFNGTIDEVAVFPSPLTLSQVQKHYVDSGRTGNLPTAPADAYGAAVFRTGPEAYWRLDETSGTSAADASVNGAPGKLSGLVTYNQASPVTGTGGRGIKLDGSTATLASSLQYGRPDAFTEQVWFSTTTTKGGQLIGLGSAQSGKSTNYDRQVFMNNAGRISFAVRANSQVVLTTPGSYNDGKWHFVAASQDSNGMRLYVDGRLLGSSPTTLSTVFSGYWRVGGDNTYVWGAAAPTNNFLLGSIDEPAVHLRALSQAEIDGIWHASPASVNAVPTADFTATCPTATCSFDAGAATDPDGGIASYAWDFGDGTTGSGVNPSHKFASGGSANVTLTVTDTSGATTTVTKAVSVPVPVNQAPVATINSASCVHLTCSFDGSASTDPDGSIAGYSWDFGDGSPAATGATATHTFPGGPATVTLTVTDDQGATASTSVTVQPAANQAPTAAFTSTCTGLSCVFDAGTSTDSDGTIATYAWTFGDGGTSSVAKPTHVFAADGTYSVGLTVTDNDGAASTSSQDVTVAAPAVFATDTFGRTTTTGWGTADTGGAWTVAGTASNYTVNGSAGRMTNNVGSTPNAYLNSVVAADATGTVDISLSALPVLAATATGTPSESVWVTVRHTATAEYQLQLKITADGTTSLQWRKLLGTTPTGLGTAVLLSKYAVGDVYRLRFQVTGSSTMSLLGKAWKVGSAEPAAWQVSASDSDGNLTGPGSIGVKSSLSGSAAAPIVITFDNLDVRKP